MESSTAGVPVAENRRERQRLADPARSLASLFARGPVTLLEGVGLLLLCVAAVAAASWVLRMPVVLGHDESVYAVMARNWLGEGPSSGVGPHRGPLLPGIGVPILALGGGERALRAVGVVFSLGGVVSCWWLGRMIGGAVAGLLGAAVFAFAPTVFEAASLFLTDLPAAAVLVALAGVLWSQLAAGDPDRRLLFAAPLAAAAFLLRYGSALVVILLFLTCIVLFWTTVRRHARLGLQMVGLLVVLLVPHLIHATIELGAPWGRVFYTAEVSGRDYLGQGLVEYLRWFPGELAGRIAAAVMTVGLVGSLVIWVLVRVRTGAARPEPHLRMRARGLAFLVVPAVGHVVAIGIASHGEPRFVFFAIAMLCIAGATVLAAALQPLARRSSSAVVILVGLAVLGMVLHVGRLAPTQAGVRADLAERHALIVVASEALRSLAGEDCSVLTSYSPQITWYSGCASEKFRLPADADRQDQLTEDGWMLLFEDGKHQPQGQDLATYLDGAELVRSWDPPHEGILGSAELYRFTPGE